MNVFNTASCLLALVLFCVPSLESAAVDYGSEDLSNYLHLCEINSPTRDECIKSLIQEAVDKYNQGLEQFGIPQFEPLSYDRLRFDFDSPILLLSSLRLKNFKVAGFGKTKVISVETNFTDNEMMATVVTEIPRIFVDGLYKGEGRYTNIRVAPKGRFNVTAVDITTRITLAGRTEVRNGETYMVLRKFDFVPVVIGDMKVNVEGLFPDTGLTLLANELINQNWRVMFDVMMDEVRRVLEPFFLEPSNSFLTTVPFRKLFL